MNYLVDTNILTRISDPAHALHQESLGAVKLLIQQGHTLHVVPQNLYEFWVVATRPETSTDLEKPPPRLNQTSRTLTIHTLRGGKLVGFSTNRLFRFLNALANDVEIVIRLLRSGDAVDTRVVPA